MKMNNISTSENNWWIKEIQRKVREKSQKKFDGKIAKRSNKIKKD